MKKVLIVVLALLVICTLASAQYKAGAYKDGVGIPFNIDKLGAHQNGGRGCVGCHAPHSGSRGNGGGLTVTSVYDGTTHTWSSPATDDGEAKGDDVLWGQDFGPIYGTTLNFPTSGDYSTGVSGDVTMDASWETSHPRMISGVAMCLSCHDGNVTKGAMMTNQSFEQAAGLLPPSYGSHAIPTLLGDDGGPTPGNYGNDHPVGPNAKLGYVGHGAIGNCTLAGQTCTAKNWFAISGGVVATGTNFPGSAMEKFATNYGLPTITGARAGAGFAVDPGESQADNAYVVCTTCHTPHSMYTASMIIPVTGKGYDVSKPGATGTYPSYFFIAAPYNPGADTAGGTKASSATQFCRQCHFSGPGGANEASGISIPTAF